MVHFIGGGQLVVAPGWEPNILAQVLAVGKPTVVVVAVQGAPDMIFGNNSTYVGGIRCAGHQTMKWARGTPVTNITFSPSETPRPNTRPYYEHGYT